MKVQNYSSKFILSISVLVVGLFSLGFFTLYVNAEHGEDGIKIDLLEGSNTVNFRDSTNTMSQSSTLSVDSSTIKAGFIIITVEEKDSNLDATNIDIIPANITSTSDPVGNDFLLTETGVDTAIFVGTAEVSPFESPGVLQIAPGDEIMYEPEPEGVPRVSAKIGALANPGSVIISDFIVDTPTEGARLCPADIVVHPINMQLILSSATQTNVTISYANALLEPLDDVKFLKMYYRIDDSATFSKLLNLEVKEVEKTVTGTKTKSHLSATLDGQYAIGFEAGCEGGVGGGLVRPGLVVNALAGSGSLVGLFTGGSGGGAKPTFGDASVMVLENSSDGFAGIILDGAENSFESTKVVETGETVVLRFDLYENQGINSLERFIMHLNFEGTNYDTSTIDTHITYESGGQLTLVDPHDKIEKVEIEILQKDPWNLVVKVSIVFKNTFNTSVLVESWDLDRNSGKKIFPDLLEIVEPSLLLADAQIELETTEFSLVNTDEIKESKLTEIPIWVKNNALWWQQKQIDDSDFMAGIEYLIKKSLIEIDQNNLSYSETSKETPLWISDVAGMWANDSITDEEFIDAMKWLITNGILQVQQ